MGYDGSLKFDTGIDESGFNKGIKKLGSIAKGGLAVLAGAISGVTFAALDSVASLEQNIGGVETLFKESADTVIANAKRAYETAGMSANNYMSTVTSFAASLLQSLGGDTAKAADYADRAVRDMSDNANKMGTSMELIQNAYQGFAKQNYTMLDNLKLGYGGTQKEMERLIKDASKLTDVQEKLGVTVDGSSLSFGNIVNAISVMQESMGIAGTTAAEAATTIEGSMNSAKAALDNFLNGTADVDTLVQAFSTAATVITKNLTEIIPRVAETIPAAIEAMIPMIVEMGASLVEVGKGIMNDFVSGLSESIPQITERAGEIASTLITGVQEKAPEMLATAAELIASFVTGIAEQLPTLIPQALQMVVTLADAVISNMPTIVNMGIEIINSLVTGILNSLPQIISSAGTILSKFIEFIMQNLPTVLGAGVQLVLSMVNGIIQSLPEIISAAVTVVGELLNTVLSNAPKLIEGGLTLIGELAAGIISAVPELIGKIPGIISDIKKEFTSIDWGQVGKDILSGIANGVVNGVGSLVTAARNAAESALDAIKKKLGIHSPSTVFRDQVGKNMALGMGEGFEDNVPVDDMNDSISKSVQKLQRRAATVTTNSGTTVTGNLNLTQSQNRTSQKEESEDMEVQIVNVFQVDGDKLVEKTTRATIKKLNGKQQDENKVKGK